MARKRSSTMANSSETQAPPRRRTMTAPASSHLSASNGVNVEDEIRNLAYQKWQEAGCPDSDGVYFWLEAEAELQRR